MKSLAFATIAKQALEIGFKDRPERKDDDEVYIPFQGLEKGTVLQEVRVFNEVPLVPRHCIHVLSKILYVLAQSEKLTSTEATDTFFAVTKLFQSRDVPLRRMVYLTLKELLPLAEDTIMVIASLTKDMNSPMELYRSNALRVFSRIADVQILTQSERYLKQSIVDKDPSVASAALVSALHITRSPGGLDLVRRWIHEIQTALKSRDAMVQYHALGLLHQIRRNDRLALSKLVTDVSRSPVRSPFTYCLLIRYTSELLELETNGAERGRMFEFLDSCLRNKSEMVTFEAARAVCNLEKISAGELQHTVSVLQLMLSSNKATLRYAAMRALSKVSAKCPAAVVPCNNDVEALISDSNRSIATLAIGTLLKTGDEASVDRLLKHISGFIAEITDEFKLVIVDAIKVLCLKFPSKYHSMLVFLANMLRDDGGFEYKAAVISSILEIMRAVPESRELALNRLGEYIEDCEFPVLSTRVLHVLGVEGPKLSSPSRFILYIFNRVNLESSMVRAAAVGALAKFGQLPELRESIVVLLRRCLVDSDDEVRDRAVFHLRVLEADMVNDFVAPDVSLVAVEETLRRYLEVGDFSVPYSLDAVQSYVPSSKKELAAAAGGSTSASGGSSSSRGHAADAGSEASNVKLLYSVPGVDADWKLFHSSKPVALTEPETEYVIECTKHVFSHGVLALQFDCQNTVEEIALTAVTVHVTSSNGVFTRIAATECPLLRVGDRGHVFCLLRYDANRFPNGVLTCSLRYNAAEADPETREPVEEGMPDEYRLKDVEISLADFVKPLAIADFGERWAAAEQPPELAEEKVNLTLGAQSLALATQHFVRFFGLHPCNGSDEVPEDAPRHALYLAGSAVGAEQVLVRIRMRLDQSGSRSLVELCVRTSSPEVSRILSHAFFDQ